MGEVRIVTDSNAHFLEPGVVEQYGIRVVPLNVTVGGQTFKEWVELDSEEFFRRVGRPGPLPTVSPPGTDELARIYAELSKETDQILSLHLSRRLCPVVDKAEAAASAMRGRCDIAVMDSMTASAGLAILVEVAAQAAAEGHPLDDVVRLLRGAIPHVYAVFYVETLDYLRRDGLIGEAQAILGTMLGIKPFLTIEDGEIIPMEKVRTHSQAVDRLVEFVVEFSTFERLIILQSVPYHTDQTRLLIERLSAEFPDREFPVMMYGPSLGAMIGPYGMGVVVYEGLGEGVL